MLDVEWLHSLVDETVDKDKVHGAMLMTTKGSLLEMAGFDDVEAQVISAIAAKIWSYCSQVTTIYPDAGEMQVMLFDASEGILAVSSVIGTSGCFLVLFSSNRSEPGYLVARIRGLRSHFTAVPGLDTLTPDLSIYVTDKDSRL